MENLILNCKNKVLNGGSITQEEANEIILLDNKKYLLLILDAANTIRRKFIGDKIDICALINAKSGKCSEDCKYCAQSSHYDTECNVYPFVGIDNIIERAKEVKKLGVKRFCIVTSGGSVSDDDFAQILKAVYLIRFEIGLEVDCSIGHLTDERIIALKKAGLTRYNHNLETSSEYYPHICSTHSFNDRKNTVQKVKNENIEICSGGIIGLGESSQDRIKLAFSLKELNVECVPINILNPRSGTPFEKNTPLTPMEILKTIALFRFILPKATIKVAGGREHNLRSLQSMSFLAGANGLIVNGYLTTQGNSAEEDLQMLKDLELTW